MGTETKLSIIIPTWNEEATISGILETLLGLTAERCDPEIIVSVSGDDRTAELASAFPVIVCHSEKGRAI